MGLIEKLAFEQGLEEEGVNYVVGGTVNKSIPDSRKVTTNVPRGEHSWHVQDMKRRLM